MIGYNVEKINELMNTLAANYKALAQTISSGWPALSAKMEAEWIGPDEVSYETTLAKGIVSIYNACQKNVSDMIDNMFTLGMNWKRFQATNKMVDEGAVVPAGELTKPEIVAEDLSLIVKAGNPVFTASTNMGLANGAESGTAIKQQFDAYIDEVYSGVKSLYESLDSSKAFLGTELNSAVNTYLQNMGEAMAKLTTCHRPVYEALDKLIAGYTTHESEEATNVSSAASAEVNYNGQNLK